MFRTIKLVITYVMFGIVGCSVIAYAFPESVSDLANKISEQIKFEKGGQFFIDSSTAICVLARHRISFDQVLALDWSPSKKEKTWQTFMTPLNEDWFKNLGKEVGSEKFAKSLVTLFKKLIFRSNFQNTYSHYHPNNSKFNLNQEVKHLIKEFDKIDINAEIRVLKLRGRELKFFKNDEYEKNWSNVTKLMYRWEKRIPGLKEALKKELKNLIN